MHELLMYITGLVAQFLLLTGAGPYTDDSNYSEGEKTTRGYCKRAISWNISISIIIFYFIVEWW